MATPSTAIPLGAPLPDFLLVDVVTGRPVGADDLRGKPGALVMFICNHCPYVVHVRAALVREAHAALELGLGVVAINANSVRTHPQDGPDAMRTLAVAETWRFPFVFDATQDVARAFGAACTPDLYVFDRAGRLAYHGQLDDARPGNGAPITGADLHAAIAAVAAGRPAAARQTPSIGCGIKWE